MSRFYFRLLGDSNTASSRVRGYWIGDELEGLGHHVDVVPSQQQPSIFGLLKEGLKCDVVIFQKCYARRDVWAATLLRIFGRKVAFDIDDAPSKSNNPRTLRNVYRMMRLSDRVFVGSHALSDLARRAGATVAFLPTGIRLQNYEPKQDGAASKAVCLGWIGNGAQYGPDFAEILAEPLRQLAAHQPIRLKIVGARGHPAFSEAFAAIPGLQLELIDELNWSDPMEVSTAMGEFDIGLYPLQETEFNQFKCAFKALEYMACGVPVVASAVGANSDVIAHEKDGFLVGSPQEWATALGTLMSDRELCHRMGRAGRAKIEAMYTTRALARRMAEELA